MTERIVGVVPAAGRATRLPDLTGSKEILEVAGKPVIDHTFDRMKLAGADEIRVVTRREKRDVAGHARDLGCVVIEADPPHVSSSILAGSDGLSDGDVILVAFPDTLWEPPDGFTELLRMVPRFDVALGLFTGLEPARSDTVVVGGDRVVTAIEVKPAKPRTNVVWGCFAARRSALAVLEEAPEPGIAFGPLVAAGRVGGHLLSDVFIDIGTPDALRTWSRRSYASLVGEVRARAGSRSEVADRP